MHIDGPMIVLNEAEANRFFSCNRPLDREVCRRRNDFFAEIDRMQIDELEDGSVEIEFSPKRCADSRDLLAACQSNGSHTSMSLPGGARDASMGEVFFAEVVESTDDFLGSFVGSEVDLFAA